MWLKNNTRVNPEVEVSISQKMMLLIRKALAGDEEALDILDIGDGKVSI